MATKTLPPGTPIPDDALYEVVDGQIVIDDGTMPGNGVPDDIASLAGSAITIPCPGQVESLNASVAAGVMLYEASRQRRLAADRIADRIKDPA